LNFKEKNKEINKKTKQPVVDESIKIDVTEEEMGAKEIGKDDENKIGNIKEDGAIVDDMKINEQDIKKKKSSGEGKKKKGKNSGKKDLKEEDIVKKIDIIKEDGKGQLISKFPFSVAKSTKIPTKL
jgi:hypothetical protein